MNPLKKIPALPAATVAAVAALGLAGLAVSFAQELAATPHAQIPQIIDDLRADYAADLTPPQR